MNGHRLTLAALFVIAGGCAAPLTLPSAQHARAAQGAGVENEKPSATRSQKPESETGTEPAAAAVPPADSSTQMPAIQGRAASRVLATVNGRPIMQNELDQAIAPHIGRINQLQEPERSARREEIIRRELETLVERELIMSEAEARLGQRRQSWDKLKEVAGKEFEKQLRRMRENAAEQGFKCESDEEFKELLIKQGVTIEGMQRESERRFMAMEYMRHRVFPQIEKLGHKDFRQYYDDHPGEFQAEDRVKWQDIFIDASKHPNHEAARRFAEELARRARAGDDFAKLAMEYDDGLSRSTQGAGIGQRRGEIQPAEAESYLFRMREGEVAPILELSTGFHVIRLVEREYAGLVPFDDKIQTQVKRKLQNVVMEREYRRIVDEMKRKAVVEIIPSQP
ncbi:MAG: peptidyl-prolyl cis-trans isomerase [Gemmataceae bacterium]|nr:peptidyl-prolyl cis-trans isomerase [Gemmataceae bacterium]